MKRELQSLFGRKIQAGEKTEPLLFSLGDRPQESTLCHALYDPTPLAGDEEILFSCLRERLEEMEGRPVSVLLERAHDPSEDILRALCRASVYGPLLLSLPCYTADTLPSLRERLLLLSHTLRREGYDSDGGLPLLALVTDALGALTAERILSDCDGIWLSPHGIERSLAIKNAPENTSLKIADELCEELCRLSHTKGLPVGLLWEKKELPQNPTAYDLLARPAKLLWEESLEERWSGG